MRVAITRPIEQARATAERVRDRGGEPAIAPLLELEPRDFDADVAGAQALLFTSANAVRAFAARNPSRNVLVLAVGDATAESARAAGFSCAVSADGDVAAMIEKAKSALDPKGGRLIHFSGEHVAGDLVGALAAAGFRAERRIAYGMRAARALPAAFSEPLDSVLFYSARAAQAFHAHGAPGARRLVAACLSDAVAAAAGSGWRRVVVAPAPRESALLDALFASP